MIGPVDEVHRTVEDLARIYTALAKTCPELSSGEYTTAVLAVACDAEVGYEVGSLLDADGRATAWVPAPGSALHPTQLYLRDLAGPSRDGGTIAVVVQLDLVGDTRTTTLFTGDQAREWLHACAQRAAAGQIEA